MCLWTPLIHGDRREVGDGSNQRWIIAIIGVIFLNLSENLFLSELGLDRTVQLTPTGSELPGYWGTESMMGVWINTHKVEMDRGTQDTAI